MKFSASQKVKVNFIKDNSDRKFSSTFFKRWRRQGRGALVDRRSGRNSLRASKRRRPGAVLEGVKPPLEGGFRSFTLFNEVQNV